MIPQNQLFGKRLASADTRRYKLVEPGDFVYDPNLLWSGSIARSDLAIEGLVSPVYEVFREARDIAAEFLKAWLKSPSRLSQYQRISVGTNVRRRRASIKDLASITIDLPPLDEQRGIAAVLDAIDEATERSEAVIAATEELRRSLLHELLSRGVPGWHSEWREVRGLGVVPACWEVVRLGEVAGVQTGRAVNSKSAPNGSIEVPYLSVANVKDGYVDLNVVKTMHVSQDEIARYGLRPGDVLFTEGGDADKLGRGTVWRGELDPCLHQNHVFAVRTDGDRLLSRFLSIFAASRPGKR